MPIHRARASKNEQISDLLWSVSVLAAVRTNTEDRLWQQKKKNNVSNGA